MKQLGQVRAVLRRALIACEHSYLYLNAWAPLCGIFRHYRLGSALRAVAFLVESQVRQWLVKGASNSVTMEDVRQRRKSDTVFVFGSGASLNELSESEWALIRGHDVIGVNYFVHQRWVDVDIHYTREVEMPLRRLQVFRRSAMLEAVTEFCRLAKSNPRYKSTVFFLQTNFYAEAGSAILGWKLLPPDQPIVPYRGRRTATIGDDLPRSLENGIPRQAGAIGGGISIARMVGWKNIVLIGVDMYDSRYFWLPDDGIRNMALKSSAGRHPTTGRGILDIIGKWRGTLREDGVTLSVYNPRSLLASEIPVFEWPDGTRTHQNGPSLHDLG